MPSSGPVRISGGKNLTLVLDSNEYVFVFGAQNKPSCELLLRRVSSHPKRYIIKIPRTILEEVRRNISTPRFKDFLLFLKALRVWVDEDWAVPYELGAKYEVKGLKRGDAFIAAYTEWTGADCLVTENRDFLILSPLPFQVVRAEELLR